MEEEGLKSGDFDSRQKNHMSAFLHEVTIGISEDSKKICCHNPILTNEKQR